MQRKLKRLTGIIALAIGGLASGNASSMVLFSNTSYETGQSNSFLFSTVGDWAASRFSVSSGCGTSGPGCLLGSVFLPLSTDPDNPGSLSVPTSNFTVSIHSDVDAPGFIGSVGTTLTNGASLTTAATEIVYQPQDSHALYEFVAPADVQLYDDDYWIKITSNSTDPVKLTWDSVFGGARQYAISGGTFGPAGGVNSTSYGMIIEGELSAVPIPGAVWLMGSALIGFVGWGRRVKV
ncbi:MAG: hypothetical protein KDI68_09320 [Gammaproteobacteria bacterium]|nr:hypothetical protein [Gammaproteobacteria bacterium]